MEFLTENWEWIVTVVLGILSMSLGTKWSKIKSKFGQTVKEGSDVILAGIDLVQKLEEALVDDKISPDEKALLKKEAQEVTKEWKELLLVWKKDNTVPADPEVPVE